MPSQKTLAGAYKKTEKGLGRAVDSDRTIRELLNIPFPNAMLIGAYLLADGFDLHIPRGYIYGAMGFSAMVEVLNLWAKRRALRQVSPD